MLRAIFRWGGIADIAVTATWCVLLYGLMYRGWSNDEKVMEGFYTVTVLGIGLALLEILRRRRAQITL